MIRLLCDPYARVRFFAAEALGRIGFIPAVEPIIRMLEENDEEDAYLRHAGALALARIGRPAPVVALADHPVRGVRLAAVVALRRMKQPGVAHFLKDADEYVVTEAARAIHDDDSIVEALPALAGLLDQGRFSNEALLRRAVSAALRVRGPARAQNLAAFGARSDTPEAMRVEALASLGVWPRPSVFDRVDGRHRGSSSRDPTVARNAVGPIIQPLLRGGSAPVRVAAAQTAGRLKLGSVAPVLLELVSSAASEELRVAALRALFEMEAEPLEEAVQRALSDRSGSVRSAAQQMIPRLDLPADRVAELLSGILERGSIEERQSAFGALAELGGPDAEKILSLWLDRFLSGELAPEVELDLLEAVESGGSERLRSRLDAYRASMPPGDLLAAYRETLKGGSRALGRRIFYAHPAAQCVRCHAVAGRGGGVAPDLAGIGARSTREELVQSLVDPGARITPGYGTVSLQLSDGESVRGVLSAETETHLVIDTGEGGPRSIPLSEVRERFDAPSSMPPMGAILSRREIRDLIEFMSGLR